MKNQRNREFRKVIIQNKHYFTTFLLTSESKCNFRVTNPALNCDLLSLEQVADSLCFDGSGCLCAPNITIHQQSCDLVILTLEVGSLQEIFCLTCQQAFSGLGAMRKD